MWSLMNSSTLKSRLPANELGVLLRHWRDVRGRSQFDLSLDTGMSQKQISFVESGRRIPGRQTLTAIAQALDIPLRDRNTLLLAAGYAPIYSEGAWNALEMQGVTSALERMLRQHEPFPAMVMDRYWDVLMTNEAAPRFFNCFIDVAARESPRNMQHLMFDPKGMRPLMWQRVCREDIDAISSRLRLAFEPTTFMPSPEDVVCRLGSHVG
jgi:transcriptional regulator with XRE-family HTH domain